MSLPQKVIQRFSLGLERNTYFFGKLLTAEDFNLEQDYLLAREALINATLLGPGIVSGLEVRDLEDRGDHLLFTLTPGLAIDPEGRLIFVPQEKRVRVKPETRAPELILGIFYQECPREPTVSVCDPKECQPNRMREEFRIEVGTSLPGGIILARLHLREDRYLLRPTPQLLLPRAELPSERLLGLREILRTLLGLSGGLRRVEQELQALPRIKRREITFLSSPEKNPVELNYGLRELPLTQILCYLPLKYEISPKNPQRVAEEHREAIERGDLMVTSYPVRDFFRAPSAPPGPGEEAPPPSGAPVAPHLRPALLLRSPIVTHLRGLRALSPEITLEEARNRTRDLGVDLRVDPALPLNRPLRDLPAYTHVLFYPIFDGTLVPYLTLEFIDPFRGRARFRFDWEGFQKEESDLARMFLDKFKGIRFRIIFLSETQP